MINFAVVGAGRIGKMHAAIFGRLPNARLRGVVDRKQKEPNWLARAGFADAVLYPDAAAAFADDKTQAVVIAASSDSHTRLIADAVAAGKRVFCEKPVAFAARPIAELRQSLPADALVQIGFNRRFDPAFNALKEALSQGELGRVYSYHIVNRDPRRPPANFVGRSGGMLADFNVHDFDMLAHLSGGGVADVFVRGAGLLRDEALQRAGDMDTVMINARLNDGALANIDCARECGYGYDQRVEVLGERGGLRLDNETPPRPARMEATGFVTPPPKEDFIARFYESYKRQARAFVAACLGEAGCPVGLQEAARAAAVVEAATRSLQSGRSEAVDAAGL